MLYHQRTGARAEYRQQESLRVESSPSLADKFQRLKSLTVDLAFYNPGGITRTSEIKYKVNLDHAKSVFRFNCLNPECIRGDFDLTEELANAVAARLTSVSGEMTCQGWRSRTTINAVRCQCLLRYRLSLKY